MSITIERELDYNYAAFGTAIYSEKFLTPEKALIAIFGEGEGSRSKSGERRKQWSMADAIDIDMMRKQGKQWTEIGNKYGISAQSVYSIWIRNMRKLERERA